MKKCLINKGLFFIATIFLMSVSFSGAQDFPGSVFFDPAEITVWVGNPFATPIYINSGDQTMGAYVFKIIYDAQFIIAEGYEEGADGFVAAVSMKDPGIAALSGFDTSGTGPGSRLHIITVTWTALSAGVCELILNADTLVDLSTHDIGTPEGGTCKITIQEADTGDVNGSGEVDIVDALLVAQFYVGLELPVFARGAADVNYDGAIDIVDALMIARYFVGLIPELPTAPPTPTPTPSPTLAPTSAPSPVPTQFIDFELIGVLESDIGNRGGWSNGFILDDYLYIQSSSGIKIFDITDPLNPVFIKDSNVIQEMYNVAAKGNYFYYIENWYEHTWGIVDLSDPLNPERIYFTAIDRIQEQEISGNYLYISHDDSLSIYDLTDPAAPEKISTLVLEQFVDSICVAGDYLYLENELDVDQLKIIDIRDPLAPVVVSSLEVACDKLGVLGNYLYCSGDTGLSVVDISDPLNPVIIGGLDLEYTIATLRVLDGYLHITDFRRLYDDYYHQLNKSDLKIIDVRNPFSPVVVNSIEMPAQNKVVITDGNLSFYIIGGNGNGSGVYILDTVNPADPCLHTIIDGMYTARSVTVEGNLAYLAERLGGMRIVDVSDPSAPVVLSRIKTEMAEQIYIRGNYAFVADTLGGIKAIDVSDPSQPVIVDSATILDRAVDLDGAGDYLVVADRTWGYTVVDAGNPGNLSPAVNIVWPPGTTPGPTDPPTQNDARLHPLAWVSRYVKVYGNMAFFVNNQQPTLKILDISVPDNPLEICDMEDNLRDLVLKGNYLYMTTDYDELLKIYDISNPAEPVLTGFISPLSGYNPWANILVDGDYAYTSCYRGVARINISNPAAPVYTGTAPIGYISGIDLAGDYLYVVYGSSQEYLKIYKVK